MNGILGLEADNAGGRCASSSRYHLSVANDATLRPSHPFMNDASNWKGRASHRLVNDAAQNARSKLKALYPVIQE